MPPRVPLTAPHNVNIKMIFINTYFDVYKFFKVVYDSFLCISVCVCLGFVTYSNLQIFSLLLIYFDYESPIIPIYRNLHSQIQVVFLGSLLYLNHRSTWN